jgi:pRiA4b ORF-3-like protein
LAVARTWLQIKVELVSGLGGDLEPPPGRVFAVGPSLTFERLAEAINRAFGRWDLSHLHVFELADGRRVGFADVDDGEHGWVDHASAKVGSALKPGETFEFVFDFGDDWRHRCEVLADKLDAREEFGEAPREPVILWGGGLAAGPVRARERR